MGEGWDAGRDGAYGSDRGGGGVGGSSLAGWGGGIRAPFLLAHVQHLCGDDWREFERANFGLVCAGRGPPPKWAVGLLRVMAGLSATRRVICRPRTPHAAGVGVSECGVVWGHRTAAALRRGATVVRDRGIFSSADDDRHTLQVSALRASDGACQPLRAAPASAGVGARRRLHAPHAAQQHEQRQRRRHHAVHVRPLLAAQGSVGHRGGAGSPGGAAAATWGRGATGLCGLSPPLLPPSAGVDNAAAGGRLAVDSTRRRRRGGGSRGGWGGRAAAGGSSGGGRLASGLWIGWRKKKEGRRCLLPAGYRKNE